MDPIKTSVAAGTIVLCCYSLLEAGDAAQAKKDQSAVRNFLQKTFPGKKWNTGPTVIDSEEVRQVFGKGRYYYVFSATPLPPGARIKRLIDAYRKKLEEIRKHHLRASVRIDEKGKMTVFRSMKDFQRQLQPATDESRQKLVAAAVLSLYGSGRVSPGPVPTAKVAVRKTTKGDTVCTARPNRFSMGFVIFDKKGVLKGVSKRYSGPLPP